MYRGQFLKMVDAGQVTREEIGLLMTGLQR
jgi:hypothetical protein